MYSPATKFENNKYNKYAGQLAFKGEIGESIKRKALAISVRPLALA